MHHCWPNLNLEIKYQQHMAMMNAAKTIEAVDREFGDIFGRYYCGMVQGYRCDDAEVILVATGTTVGTARVVVDDMRNKGQAVGLLKLRYLRPFPIQEVCDIAGKVKAVGVLDRDISFGMEGTIYTNINSALSRLAQKPLTLNFVGGLGGRDISKENLESIFSILFKAASGENQPEVQFFGMECATDE